MSSKIRASHILVSKLSEADDILLKLRGGADFFVMAKKYSSCPSKKRGGDLGFFSKGMMVKEFEKAAFNSEIGQLVGPVKTQFGYHIIKRTAKLFHEIFVISFHAYNCFYSLVVISHNSTLIH